MGTAVRHLALNIIRIGRRADRHFHAVRFFSLLHKGNGFGRLTQGNRQNAGRQRVERTGMAGFLSLKQMTDFIDRAG